jgi:hypothetical protein
MNTGNTVAALKRSRPVRTRIRFKIEIRGSRQSFYGEARDLSVEGLCFSSPILLVPGERVGATLHFQEGLEHSISLEVRWTGPETAQRYLIGAEFVHLSESRKAMQRLLWKIESGLVKGADPGV